MEILFSVAVAAMFIYVFTYLKKLDKDIKKDREKWKQINDVFDGRLGREIKLRDAESVDYVKGFTEQHARFKQLEEKLERQIKMIAKLEFELKNPPKYKVGDKIDKVWIVTNIEIKESRGILDIASLEFRKLLGELSSIWVYDYTATHKTTGEVRVF